MTFSGLSEFSDSRGFGRRSVHAVLRTSGSKSRAARSDSVGLLCVVSVDLVSVAGAVFVEKLFGLDDDLPWTDG